MAPVDGAFRFRMEDAPAGAVTVRAEAASMNGTQRSSRPLELTLAAGSETEVVLEFPDDIVIGGLITRDGTPVPFAGVHFSRDDVAASGTRADARGAYEIVGVDPASTRSRSPAPTCRPRSRRSTRSRARASSTSTSRAPC